MSKSAARNIEALGFLPSNHSGLWLKPHGEGLELCLYLDASVRPALLDIGVRAPNAELKARRFLQEAMPELYGSSENRTGAFCAIRTSMQRLHSNALALTRTFPFFPLSELILAVPSCVQQTFGSIKSRSDLIACVEEDVACLPWSDMNCAAVCAVHFYLCTECKVPIRRPAEKIAQAVVGPTAGTHDWDSFLQLYTDFEANRSKR